MFIPERIEALLVIPSTGRGIRKYLVSIIKNSFRKIVGNQA
jgi:hypothetical protein